MITIAHVFHTGVQSGALLLIFGGLTHMRDRRAFREVLNAQRLLSPQVQRVVGMSMGYLEIVIGLAAVSSWLFAFEVTHWTYAMVAVAYVGFGVYSAALRLRRPLAPCGCLGADNAVTWFTVIRAWLLAATAGAGAAVGSTTSGDPIEVRLLVLAGAAGIGFAIWLREALGQPMAGAGSPVPPRGRS